MLLSPVCKPVLIFGDNRKRREEKNVFTAQQNTKNTQVVSPACFKKLNCYGYQFRSASVFRNGQDFPKK